MISAVFVDQTIQRRAAQSRQELILLSLVSVMIVATGVLGQVATAGLLTGGALLMGAALIQASGSALGLRRASMIGVVHYLAIVLFVVSSAT